MLKLRDEPNLLESLLSYVLRRQPSFPCPFALEERCSITSKSLILWFLPGLPNLRLEADRWPRTGIFSVRRMKTQYPVQEWWLLYNSMFKYHPLLPLLPLPFSSSLSFSGIARYLSLLGTYKQQTTISSCSLERLDHLRKKKCDTGWVPKQGKVYLC